VGTPFIAPATGATMPSGTGVELQPIGKIYKLQEYDSFPDVIAAINFLAVIVLFFLAARDRQRERDEDFREKVRQRDCDTKNFWIQEVIFRPNVETLNRYFASVEEILINWQRPGEKSTEEAQAASDQFKILSNSLDARVIAPLASIDDNFSKLSITIDEFEDLVVTTLEGTRIPAEGEPTDPLEAFHKLQKRLIQEFHLAHKQCLKDIPVAVPAAKRKLWFFSKKRTVSGSN
jgi:hypothetical protein